MARMIDANALMKAMRVHTYMQTEWTPATAWGVPIVDAEPIRHGHWIYTERGFPLAYGYNRCSVCQRSIGLDSTAYCPNCGAKMDNTWEEPEINPCRGCTDYDGQGGCKSNGGCGAKMDEVSE